ncbi:MAG: hypothetical protein ABI840_12630, partial [bacterium]
PSKYYCMKNSLTESLKLIKKEEWNDFEKFSASAFFNKGRNYLPLLKIFRKYHPGFEADEFTEEFVYRKLYPAKDFNKNVLKVIFSGLNKITEEYFTYTCFNSDVNSKKFITLDALISRGSVNRSIKLMNEIDYYMNKKPFGMKDLRDRITLLNLNIKSDHVNERSNKQNITHQLEVGILYAFDCTMRVLIDRIDLVQNHRFPLSDKNVGNLLQIHNLLNVDEIMKLLKNIDNKLFEKFQTLAAVYSLMKISDENSYIKLKNLLKTNEVLFDKDLRIRLLMYLYLMNSILFNKSVKISFIEDNVLILEKLIDDEFYRFTEYTEYLDIRMFMNGVIGYQILSKFDEADLFISKYIGKLAPDFQKDAFEYSSGIIEFDRGNFDKALEKLTGVNLKDISITLDIKKFICQIYYETNSFSSLYPLLDSYSHYVQSLKNEDNFMIKRNIKFIKNLRKISKIKENNPGREKVEILKNEFEKTGFRKSSWFMMKIEELLTKVK